MRNAFKELERSIHEIVRELSEREKRQDEVLRLQREVIRDCALAIKHVHTGEYKESNAVVKEIDAKIKRLRELSEGFEQVAAQCFQEYVEIKALQALLAREPIPSREALGVDAQAYLNGLADTAGELRRAIQLALRHGSEEKAEYYFNAMNAIYDNLMLVKFSSSLVGPLKHKQDVIRSQLEQARSEMLRSK